MIFDLVYQKFMPSKLIFRSLLVLSILLTWKNQCLSWEILAMTTKILIIWRRRLVGTKCFMMWNLLLVNVEKKSLWKTNNAEQVLMKVFLCKELKCKDHLKKEKAWILMNLNKMVWIVKANNSSQQDKRKMVMVFWLIVNKWSILCLVVGDFNRKEPKLLRQASLQSRMRLRQVNLGGSPRLNKLLIFREWRNKRRKKLRYGFLIWLISWEDLVIGKHNHDQLLIKRKIICTWMRIKQQQKKRTNAWLH